MKRWIFKEYGDPSVLEQEEFREFKPMPGQIGVRVGACSLNPIDWKLMSGKLKFLAPVKFPSVPCFDLAGVVEDQNGIEEFRTGDRIFVRLNTKRGGAASTHVGVDPAVAAKIPEGLSIEEAASIPLAALTALQGLRDHGGLAMENANKRVLIVGASGGVGHFAVQIAAAAGAHVTAVCGTRNLEMVKSLGADELIDYRERESLQSGDGLAYDLVFDCVGEAPLDFARRFPPLMSKGGIYVTPVPSGGILLRLLQLWRNPRPRVFLVKPVKSDLNFLSQLYEEGKLRPVIDSIFSFDQLPQAFEQGIRGRTSGKIVIRV